MEGKFDNVEEEEHVRELVAFNGNREFQSYSAIADQNKNITQFIAKALNDATELIIDEPTRRAFMRKCVLQMIRNEIDAIPRDIRMPPKYYVFYRLVQKQIVLYELNTCILEHMGMYKRNVSNQILCIPYLNEEIYPRNLEQLTEWLSEGNSDIGTENEDDVQRYYHLTLLCVNNCMHPIVNRRGFNRFLPGHVEAKPLTLFGSGYDIGGRRPENAMISSLTTVYEISVKEAEVIVIELIRKYIQLASMRKGHLIQIALPNTLESMEKYMYTSVPYGHPVITQIDKNGKHYARKIYDDTEDDNELVSMRQVLSSPDMSYLQTRIIGHPNLFLKDGAFAEVFSSEPSFKLENLGIMEILKGLTPRDDRSWFNYQKFPRTFC